MLESSESNSRRAIEAIEESLWLLLLALAPLVTVSAAYDSYMLPKFFWAETLIVALACVSLLQFLLGRRFRFAFNGAVFAFICYGIWHAVSTRWAASRSLALDESRFWMLLALALVLFQSAFHGCPRRQRRLGLAFLISAGITALWALWHDFAAAFWPALSPIQNKLGDWRGSIAAGFGNTSHIGDFLAVTYPLAFLAFLRAKRFAGLAFRLLLLWVSYAALIVCFSVHSNTGLILAMAVTLWLLWRRLGFSWIWARKSRLAILIVGWAVIASFFSLDAPGNPHRPGIFKQAFSSDRLAYGWDSRLYIWRNSLEMAARSPWLGYGSGNLEYVYPTVCQAFSHSDEKLFPLIGSWTNATHNTLLQSWAELGIVGPALLLTMFALACQALHSGIKDDDSLEGHARLAVLAGLAAFAVHAQMNFPLQLAASSLAWMTMIGLAAALAPGPEERLQLPNLSLDYDWIKVGFEMATFRRPRAMYLEMRPAPRTAILAGLLVCLPVAGFQMWGASLKLRSDMTYRRASGARRAAEQVYALRGLDSADTQAAFDRADESFRKALSFWPDHHNCRSEYSEMLLKCGHGLEALEQVNVTLERLMAWELFWRRGRAYMLMGDLAAAREEFRAAFNMCPIQAYWLPHTATWASGEGPLGANARHELRVPIEMIPGVTVSE